MSQTAVKASELVLRPEIATAADNELFLIDRQIARLRRERSEIKKLKRKVAAIGKAAYLLSQETGPYAALHFAEVSTLGNQTKKRVLDLRGYCDMYQQIDSRHVDLWVKIKPELLGGNGE